MSNENKRAVWDAGAGARVRGAARARGATDGVYRTQTNADTRCVGYTKIQTRGVSNIHGGVSNKNKWAARINGQFGMQAQALASAVPPGFKEHLTGCVGHTPMLTQSVLNTHQC